MHSSSVVEFPLQNLFPRQSPEIPALPETLLRLDLLLQQCCVDVRELKRLVLGDVGATLQVFRASGQEFSSIEERPVRIEDCIFALGPDACSQAVSRLRLPKYGWQPPLVEFWAHSKDIALYCKMIAENTTIVDADQAYLVGLLHGIGSLPGLLGWKGAGVLHSNAAGVRIAQHCATPKCVMEYLADVHQATGRSAWPNIVRMAHGAVLTMKKASRSPGSLSGILAHTI